MSRRDQEYIKAFESLDPELREEMRRAGISGPDFVCDSGFRHNHVNHDNSHHNSSHQTAGGDSPDCCNYYNDRYQNSHDSQR